MKSKVTAGILALILGSLGGHRFYLGQVGKGILYLVFCWTFIPGFIALIDAIIFFTMSDEAFDAKYNPAYAGAHHRNAQQHTVVINNNMGQAPAAPASSVANEQIVPENTPHQEPTVKEPKRDPFDLEGDVLFENYDFDGAIRKFQQSLRLNSKNPEVHFKLARLYSILEKTEQALFHLNGAVENGFYDFDQIQDHDNLAYLRSQPEFANFKANGYKPVKGITAPPEDTLELSDSVIDQVERLAKLRDSGILSDAEFTQQKHKLLS